MSPPRSARAKVEDGPAVLVTGAAGALARRVIERLHPKQAVVAVDVRRRADLDAGIPSYQVAMEKRDLEPLFRRHPIGSVVHLGRIFTHEQNRQRRYNANVLGTKHLFELAQKYGVAHMVVHSTYSVYGASPDNPALLDEDHPLRAGAWPEDLIDAVELENLSQIYLRKEASLCVTLLRPCNILGPGVRNTLSLMLRRSWAPVMVGHAPPMQFLHVDDMAEALLKALAQPQPGVFNVAPAESLPYPEALRLCGCRALPLWPSATGLRLLDRALGRHSLLPPYLVPYLQYPVLLDGARFRQRFGWAPRRRLDELLADYRRRKR